MDKKLITALNKAIAQALCLSIDPGDVVSAYCEAVDGRTNVNSFCGERVKDQDRFDELEHMFKFGREAAKLEAEGHKIVEDWVYDGQCYIISVVKDEAACVAKFEEAFEKMKVEAAAQRDADDAEDLTAKKAEVERLKAERLEAEKRKPKKG